ncbi:metallophosphoesterase [candidate division KSB1 bacterium]|nr:metallophosphoesterase [candidate division KSB1 bacterium]
MSKKGKQILILNFILVLLWSPVKAGTDTLTVVQITDIHFCNLVGYQPEFIKARQHYGEGKDPLKTFFNMVPQNLKADAVIITGDLIDYYEAETEKGPYLDTQIEQFERLCEDCPVPMFLTLGNHDITSYWIEQPDKVMSYQIHAQKARACWIRNLASFQDGTYYTRTFHVGQTRYHFIFLDNGYSLGNGEYLDKPQLDWLNFQVQKAADDPVVIFTHKYLPVRDYNGDGVVFSATTTLDINSEKCSKGFLKTLNENKNIKALFVGHGHNSISELLPFPAGHQILQTETAGFAQDSSNWRLLKFTEDKIIVYSTGQVTTELVKNIK